MVWVEPCGQHDSPLLLQGVWKAALMVSVGAALFFTLWIVHIQLLPYSGHGDTFSSAPFKAVLVPSPINGGPQPPRPADPDACPNHANAWSDCGFSPSELKPGSPADLVSFAKAPPPQ